MSEVCSPRCGKRIRGANFDIDLVFPSNYGFILLSFQDMITGRTTERQTSATNACLALEAGER